MEKENSAGKETVRWGDEKETLRQTDIEKNRGGRDRYMVSHGEGKTERKRDMENGDGEMRRKQ
jgi:hypothetical protein